MSGGPESAVAHASTKLRQAGTQLRRKMEATSQAIAVDRESRAMLGGFAQREPVSLPGLDRRRSH